MGKFNWLNRNRVCFGWKCSTKTQIFATMNTRNWISLFSGSGLWWISSESRNCSQFSKCELTRFISTGLAMLWTILNRTFPELEAVSIQSSRPAHFQTTNIQNICSSELHKIYTISTANWIFFYFFCSVASFQIKIKTKLTLLLSEFARWNRSVVDNTILQLLYTHYH